jgi:hypothetical protein
LYVLCGVISTGATKSCTYEGSLTQSRKDAVAQREK